MNTHSGSAWRAIWALTWRSVVFLPLMLLVSGGVLMLWLGRFVLPFYGALFLYLREWGTAAGVFGLWILLLWVYRRFRISGFLEPPPSLL